MGSITDRIDKTVCASAEFCCGLRTLQTAEEEGRKKGPLKGIQPNAQRRGWYRTWSEWLVVVGRWEEKKGKGKGMDERWVTR